MPLEDPVDAPSRKLAPGGSALHPGRGRVDAVDCARGLALIGMGVYHLSWDLADFRLVSPMLPFTLPMRLFSHTIASVFLALVGVSLALAHRKGLNMRAFWRRLAIVAGAAALVTAGSFAFAPGEAITFGILHCIAVASLAALPFVMAPAWASLAIGVAAIAAPFVIRSTLFDPSWLLWTGLGERLPNTLDWRPLLPWGGVVFLGLGAARLPGVLDRLTAPWARALLRRPREPAHLSRPSADPDRAPRGAHRLGSARAESGPGRVSRRLRAGLRRPRPHGRRLRRRLPLRRRRGRSFRRRRPAGDDHARAPGRAQAPRRRLHGAMKPAKKRLSLLRRAL